MIFKLKAGLGFNQKLKKQINQMIQFLFYTRMKKNLQDFVQRLLFAQFIRVIGQYLILSNHVIKQSIS